LLRFGAHPQAEALIHRVSDRSGWRERYGLRIDRFLQRLASDDPNAADELSAILLENVAGAVFLFVPLYALLLKLVVRRPRRAYVEHLVMSLNVHAFVFVAFTAMTPASALPSEVDALATRGLMLVIAVYLVLAFRRAYASTTLRALGRSAGAFLLYALLVTSMFLALALLSMATSGPSEAIMLASLAEHRPRRLPTTVAHMVALGAGGSAQGAWNEELATKRALACGRAGA
jgi:hypothetical protein